jgi:hypothetical protein
LNTIPINVNFSVAVSAFSQQAVWMLVGSHSQLLTARMFSQVLLFDASSQNATHGAPKAKCKTRAMCVCVCVFVCLPVCSCLSVCLSVHLSVCFVLLCNRRMCMQGFRHYCNEFTKPCNAQVKRRRGEDHADVLGPPTSKAS